MDTLPDKIYISHLCDTTIDGEEGHLMAMSFEENGGEKFIRKDALLEWAKEEQAKCSSETHPYAMFMNVVIDKLNVI